MIKEKSNAPPRSLNSNRDLHTCTIHQRRKSFDQKPPRYQPLKPLDDYSKHHIIASADIKIKKRKKSVRLELHEGEDPGKVIEEFCRKYHLTPKKMEKLKQSFIIP